MSYNMTTILLSTCLILHPISASAKKIQVNPDFEIDLYGTLDISTKWTTPSNESNAIKLDSGALSDSLIGLHSKYNFKNDYFIETKLESAINIVDRKFINTEHKFNQAMWFGLGLNEFGEFRYGRQYTVGREFTSELEIGSWKDLGIGALLRAADNYQVHNQYSWHSPKFSNFQVGISYSPDIGIKTLSQSENIQQYSIAARYITDKFYISSSFEMIDKLNKIDFPNYKPQAFQLGMKYSPTSNIQFSWAWSQQKNGFVGLNGQESSLSSITIGADDFLNNSSLNAFYLASAFKVRTGELRVQYSEAKARFKATDLISPKAKVMSIGYVYPYSESLQLYSYLAHTRNYSVDEVWDSNRSKITRFGIGAKYDF